MNGQQNLYLFLIEIMPLLFSRFTTRVHVALDMLKIFCLLDKNNKPH